MTREERYEKMLEKVNEIADALDVVSCEVCDLSNENQEKRTNTEELHFTLDNMFDGIYNIRNKLERYRDKVIV